MALAVQNIIESDITETLGYIRNGNSLLLIRPTFYNAEEFIAKLASSVQYKTLIVHTNSRSKDRINFRLTRPSGVEMITYKALALGNAGDISIHGYGLIIFADAHSMLANNTNIAIERILKLNKAVLVGITSTPIRSDGKDVTKYFDYIDKDYGIGQAIDNNDIKELTYICCLEPTIQEKYIDTGIKNQDRKREILDILNIRGIVKRAFAENFGDKQEISIAAFTQGGQSLKEAIEGLKRILDRAFTNEYRTLRKGTKVLEYRDGAYGTRRINIQINPNTNDIRGNQVDCVFLLRKTYSAARFTRQIGFALRLQSRYKPLIIDFVDNINSDTLVGYNKVHTGYSDKNLQISSNIVKVNLIDYRVSLKDFLEKERKLIGTVDFVGAIGRASNTNTELKDKKKEPVKTPEKPEENKGVNRQNNNVNRNEEKRSAEYFLVNRITERTHPWAFDNQGNLRIGTKLTTIEDRQLIYDEIRFNRKEILEIYTSLSLERGCRAERRSDVLSSVDDAIVVLFGVEDTSKILCNRNKYENRIYSEVEAFGEAAENRALDIPKIDIEIAKITPTSIFETNMLDIRDKYLPKYQEYYKNYKIGRVDEEAGKLLRTMRKYEIGNVNRTKILAELASLLIALKAQLIIELFSYRYDATALILANPSLEGTYLELISANKTDELVAYRIQELEDRVDHIAARLEEAKTENILDSKYLEYKMLPMIDKLHDRRNCMLNFQREYFRLIKRKRALQSLLKHIMVLREDIMKALVIQ